MKSGLLTACVKIYWKRNDGYNTKVICAYGTGIIASFTPFSTFFFFFFSSTAFSAHAPKKDQGEF